MTWLISPRTLVRGRDERLCRVRALYRPWRHTTQVSYPGEFPRDFPSGPSGHSVCYREWTILVCRFKDHYLVQRDIFAISKIKECRTKNISHCDLGINICLSVVISKIKIGVDNDRGNRAHGRNLGRVSLWGWNLKLKENNFRNVICMLQTFAWFIRTTIHQNNNIRILISYFFTKRVKQQYSLVRKRLSSSYSHIFRNNESRIVTSNTKDTRSTGVTILD